MVELWFQEFGVGILKLFLNPLLYWIFILIFLVGYKRIKMEREQFGVKVFDLFSEWRRTLLPAVLTGILISLIFIGAGVVFSYGSLIILSFMMILLSLNLRFTLLSASYTVGLTYIVLLFLPSLLEKQDIIPVAYFAENNFIGLTFLLGVMLVVEAIYVRRVRRGETFPRLVKSERGIWIGEHHLSKMAMIPLFFLVPGGALESFAPYWPLIPIGGESYGIILFPFLLGFSHRIRANVASVRGKQLGKQILWLGIVVMIISVVGYFFKGLSPVALVVAIFGREFITYRLRTWDKKHNALFKPEQQGLRILGIIPGTPAERLDIQVGEVITKINDKRINSSDEFYAGLQAAGAYFKLEILDDNGEMRFVQSAFYESDHYQLGLLFIEAPHRTKEILVEGS
ncbi:PDZ domain-containing protein [Oceanobacillus indicireducens]|uniref:Membrane protein n=1 Tax=Oceanobacillus indicireducens TaxID=1004261 RepID=A0A917XVG5_9BACI|nr:PDZ domain-containing protein [Oceanobacillus indicireducens]GGN53736.1 membrane protein [Oceanobacillus indicireducens]